MHSTRVRHIVALMSRVTTFPIYDRILGGRLEKLLRRYRAQGLSYEAIARRLYVDHDVEVTGKTVNRWMTQFDDREPAA